MAPEFSNNKELYQDYNDHNKKIGAFCHQDMEDVFSLRLARKQFLFIFNKITILVILNKKSFENYSHVQQK